MQILFAFAVFIRLKFIIFCKSDSYSSGQKGILDVLAGGATNQLIKQDEREGL
jgi:hypothetical protein